MRFTPFAAITTLIILYLINPLSGYAEPPFALARPVNCELGRTCYFQNFVDHDPSEKVLDFQCGHRTYDGHDGTDIRLPDLESQKAGVEVLAAAAGTVTRMRDGVDDVSVREAGKHSIAGRECGNGLLIEHEQGWSTQYCHLANRSILVRPGQHVNAGEVLGLVGLSGDTEFPHLHFTVRHYGAVVDPFAFEVHPDSCKGGHPIWMPSLLNEMRYESREIINAGFAGAPVTMDMIETGEVKLHLASTGAEALVAYIRAIGLQAGDEQTLEIRAPNGQMLAQSRWPPLDRDKAQFYVSTGRKPKEPHWPPGTYVATYVVTKNGIEVLRKGFELQLRG